MEKSLRDYFTLVDSNPMLFDNTNSAFRIILEKDIISEWQEKIFADKNSDKKKHDPNWSKIGVVYEDNKIIILRDLVETLEGHRFGYSRLFNKASLEGYEAVVVFPIMVGKIILLHQYRHATRSWHYEVPRGFGERGFSAEQNARKEIREEIEGKITRLINLGIYHNNTGLEGHSVTLFLANISSSGKPEINEGIDKYLLVSIEQFEEMLLNNQITDGFTIAAYTKAKLFDLLEES